VEELEHLHEAIRELALARLNTVTDQALAVASGADAASVQLLGDDGFLTVVAGSGEMASHVGARLRVDSTFSGLAITTGEVQVSLDVASDPKADRASAIRLGIGSLVCVPLSLHGNPLGVLQVSAAEPAQLTAADASLLANLADFVSVMVGSVADLDRVTESLWEAEPADDLTALPTGESAGRAALLSFVANVLTPHVVEDVATRLRVEAMLAADDLRVVFQPVLDLATGDVAGYEALARFSDGRPPGVWFADAHRAGLGVDLELAAITLALDTMPDSRTAYLAVNASPSVLIASELHELIAARGSGGRMVVELTEHEAVADYEATRIGIAHLRSLGVRIAIDDVGSGFASMRHVVDLRPDIIKIDRTLVSFVDQDPARHGLSVAFTQLAAVMGWTVVAEGIERPEELATCRSIGITCGQGYLLGRPSPRPSHVQNRFLAAATGW